MKMKVLIKTSFSLLFITLFLFLLNGKTLLLDDFNSGIAKNKFGGENVPWCSEFPAPIASITSSFDGNPLKIFGRTGYSVKLVYDISVSNSYCGYAFQLNKKDLSEYNYLSFWVKGEKREEFFKVDFKSSYFNVNRQVAKSYITDYLDKGVTTEWQKVVIPLDTFAPLGQCTIMSEFNIVFENSQSENNGSPTASAIFIDDIIFGTWEPGYVRLDHYGDNIGITGLGGNMGDGPSNDTNAPVWHIHSFTNVDYSPYTDILNSRSVLLRYNVSTNKSFAFCYNIIGGGTNGFIKVECDFSDYSYVTFYVKALSAAENPKGMIFELKHEIIDSLSTLDPWAAYRRFGVNTNWTKFKRKLNKSGSGFSGTLHKTNINIYSFVFEHDRIKLIGGAINGAVLIDNLQFEIEDYTPDIVNPVIPYRLKSDTHTVTNGYIFSITNQLSVTAENDIDDFNSGLAENKFGGENMPFASVFPDPVGSISPVFYNNPVVIFGRTGYSIRLDYDVSVSESYCGYALKLNKKDLSGYNYLSFWVKGKNGGEYFKIEIKSDCFNKNQQCAKFYITDYLDKGVTTEWQKVVIPLDAFISLGQWTNMNEFNIVFENSQLEVNGSLTKGTIYIDDILFGSWEPGYVRMDHYGDKIGIIGLGGNMGDGPSNDTNASVWHIHSFTNVDYSPYTDILNSRSVLLRYNVSTNESFAFCYNIIGGGTNGFIKVESDFSDYSYVSFYAKALSSAENPKEMNFELKHEITSSLSTLDPWTAYKRN